MSSFVLCGINLVACAQLFRPCMGALLRHLKCPLSSLCSLWGLSKLDCYTRSQKNLLVGLFSNQTVNVFPLQQISDTFILLASLCHIIILLPTKCRLRGQPIGLLIVLTRIVWPLVGWQMILPFHWSSSTVGHLGCQPTWCHFINY